MSEFAEYQPNLPGGVVSASGLRIRGARAEDVPALARLTAEREGSEPERYLESLERQIAADPEECRLFVARLGEEVAGFARVGRLAHEGLPAGWYLTGVIVAREHRRRGIGRALTRHRIAWLASRADAVHYFANERNRASIDLHARLGFVEVAREITVPGCTFEDGLGVLYRLAVS